MSVGLFHPAWYELTRTLALHGEEINARLARLDVLSRETTADAERRRQIAREARSVQDDLKKTDPGGNLEL